MILIKLQFPHSTQQLTSNFELLIFCRQNYLACMLSRWIACVLNLQITQTNRNNATLKGGISMPGTFGLIYYLLIKFSTEIQVYIFNNLLYPILFFLNLLLKRNENFEYHLRLLRAINFINISHSHFKKPNKFSCRWKSFSWSCTSQERAWYTTVPDKKTLAVVTLGSIAPDGRLGTLSGILYILWHSTSVAGKILFIITFKDVFQL